MRLWSIHPVYLDAKGLVAAWREALLAKKVLRGATRGYRQHPQLDRFRQSPSPQQYINAYLAALLNEAARRGYRFDRRKIGRSTPLAPLPVTSGQLAYEWKHLRGKLKTRDPDLLKSLRKTRSPLPHPIFERVPGPVATWERVVD